MGTSDPIDRFLVELSREVGADIGALDLFVHLYPTDHEARIRYAQWKSGEVLPFLVYAYVFHERKLLTVQHMKGGVPCDPSRST